MWEAEHSRDERSSQTSEQTGTEPPSVSSKVNMPVPATFATQGCRLTCTSAVLWNPSLSTFLIAITHADDAATSRLACMQQDIRQQGYTSDSGRSSKAGAIPERPQHKPSRQDKGSMTGATQLHTESRPSMLSADRIALTQHSGAHTPHETLTA